MSAAPHLTMPPAALTPQLAAIPATMTALDQWVCWRFLCDDHGRWTKQPINARTGDPASTTNHLTWAPFALAREGLERGTAAETRVDGIGYVFSPDDPFTGIDVDGLIDPETGQPQPELAALLSAAGTYAELSVSGTGAHLIVAGTLPGRGRKAYPWETYDHGRFFTVSGHRLGRVAEPQPWTGLADWYRRTFPQHQEAKTSPPNGHWVSDAEVLSRARSAKNGDKFRALYDQGDLAGHDGDESAADLALMSTLAFWTQDAGQLERLFSGSALGRRAKWQRADYRERTIKRALERQEFYEPGSEATITGGQQKPQRQQEEPTADDRSTWEPIAPARPLAEKPVLDDAALYGLPGDITRVLAPLTEAAPAALLLNVLVMFGNAAGRGPSTMVGETRHGANVFGVLVGDTSSAKGESASYVERLMTLAARLWAEERLMGGISSGEGIIEAIHDERSVWDAKAGEWKVTMPGVEDKRVLFKEEEMSAVLKAAQRRGSTTTEIIRRAWDSRPTLQTVTKTNPSKASNPHVSIIGMITPNEARSLLTETDLANGFANRFGWCYVERARVMPDPLPIPDDQATACAERIAHVIAFAESVHHPIRRDAEASAIWSAVYPALRNGKPGLAGAMTARAPAQVVRLSLIYALMEQSRVITADHLKAALALWQYCADSVAFLFGELTGDTIADSIYDLLKVSGALTKTDISNAFSNNYSGGRLAHALNLLLETGRIRGWKVTADSGRGRPSEVFEVAP